MSLETSLPGKRRLIQRLDFENCVLGGFKRSGKKTRKRLRARLTRDVDSEEKTPERKIQNDDHGNLMVTASGSPVLMQKKLCGSLRKSLVPDLKPSRYGEEDSSPVFRCAKNASSMSRKKVLFRSKRKITFNDEGARESSKAVSKSPVFKLNIPNDNHTRKIRVIRPGETILNFPDSSQNLIEFQASQNLMNTIESSDSNRIEEFTQESIKKLNCRNISSVEIQNIQKSSIEYLQSKKNNHSQNLTSMALVRSHKTAQNTIQSMRRANKRNSLLDRLKIILSKRYSEKLLWHHRENKGLGSTETLKVLEHWRADSNHIFKCSASISETKWKTTYLIVENRQISHLTFPNSSENLALSLRIFPPWLKLVFEEPITTTVLLNVFCLEAIEEVKADANKDDEALLQVESITNQSSDLVHLLYKSLLASQVSPFLY